MRQQTNLCSLLYTQQSEECCIRYNVTTVVGVVTDTSVKLILGITKLSYETNDVALLSLCTVHGYWAYVDFYL